MGPLGIQELLLIFFLILIVFGPRKIPEIGRTLGKALGEFRKATDDFKNTIEREVRLEELKSIRTPSMESFVTPAEAVSRSTPSPVVADVTVAETSHLSDPPANSTSDLNTADAEAPQPEPAARTGGSTT